ncbi:hypothetical protein MVEN_01808200 [Mycena venus]|uniref:Uncharacterized protein n=1 Tax=Mycena venus TaxID=2733690 RepID=A0A8H6XJ73_9AGAR|nr:hypothetical protein MVEN_01808200 [Mycena venus]
MPTANYTIDDVSPLIQYKPDGAWSAGDPSTDPSGSKYSDGTFTLSTEKGSSASFTFTGNQVWIYGAKRGNHGPYSVTIDKTTSQFDGFSAKDDFTDLFDSGSLTQGQHTVVITNQQKDSKKPFLDIDYIVWSTDSPSDPSKNIQLDDNASQFSYQPSDAWKTNLPSDFLGFQGDSGHATTNKDASVKLSFSGDTIALFGPVGPTLGTYAVKVDGKDAGTFNANNKNYAAQTALYHGDGLGDGDHTLEVINQPTATGEEYLAIDFAMVAAVPSSSSSSASASSASASASASSSASPGHKTNMALEGGYIAAGIAAFCLTLTLVGLIYRVINRRKTRREAVAGTTDVASFTNSKGANMISLNPVNSRNTHPESETAHLLDPRSMGRV